MAGVVRSRRRARAGLLVAVSVLPALLAPVGAGTALALGGPATGTDHPVPLEALVPGLPLPAGALDTPDQALAPQSSMPDETRIAAPTAAQARAAALTEFVPADDAEGVRAALDDRMLRPAKGFCSRHTGPYQRQVERFLHLPRAAGAPARQTPASCAAIRRYQRAHGIRPDIGFAGPVTWGAMTDEQAAATRSATATADRCQAGAQRVACVDQDRQLMWVRDAGRVVFGPVRIRTGRPGAATRDGRYRVYLRHAEHVSAVYGTPMPYAQFFDGGAAFHGVYGSLYAPTGSYGSVNLRMADARRLWTVLRQGDPVRVWGRKPA
jgi:hypothetical protein